MIRIRSLSCGVFQIVQGTNEIVGECYRRKFWRQSCWTYPNTLFLKSYETLANTLVYQTKLHDLNDHWNFTLCQKCHFMISPMQLQVEKQLKMV
jgi:hypothetical protein